ncbi:MAG: hypothetical protein D6730_06105 [Bacteroidetes bacterium]|nr:MAG: hypothetical protein D6730_06105 [Bacteroidota bacterium]
MRHTYSFLLLLAGLLGSYGLHAQVKPPAESLPLRLKVSYFGESVVHPGLNVGLEFPLAEKVRQKERKGRTRLREHRWFAGPQAGIWSHPNNQHVLFVKAEAGYRKTRPKGWLMEVSAGLGIQRSFYPNPLYRFSTQGEIEQLPLAGRWAMMGQLSLAMGRDLYKGSSQLPLSVYLKPGLLLQFPYNHAFMLTPVLELGVSYHLKSLFGSTTIHTSN